MQTFFFYVHKDRLTILFGRPGKPSTKNRKFITVTNYFLVFFLSLIFASHALGQSGRREQQVADSNNVGSQAPYQSDILFTRIDSIHSILNRISNAASRGFDTKEINKELPDIEENLKIIDENLSLYTSVLDVKNLQMFSILLGDMRDQIDEWRTSLINYNKELVRMNEQIIAFNKDSVLQRFSQDSTYRALYLNEFKQLKQKWVTASTSTSNNLGKINQLQASVSNDYFVTIDLQSKVRQQLRNLGAKSLSKEYDYLWDAKKAENSDKQVYEMARKSYRGQKKILQYYFNENWDTRVSLAIIGITFFWWVFRNFRRIKKAEVAGSSTQLNLRYLKQVPVLATLVIIFNLIPFLDLHPPSAYVQIMQFFLLITLTIFFGKYWPRKLFYFWIFLAVLYVLFSLTGSVLIPGLRFRIWLLVLNSLSVIFGIMFVSRFSKAFPLSVIVKPVAYIYIFLNVLALICNLFGRLSLAKVFSTAAVFGLTQIIGLAVFIQLIREALQLQMEAGRLTGGIASGLSYDKINKELTRFLHLIAGFTWILIFTINLNIYNTLYFVFSRILTKPRSIGNTSFEIGNILLFMLIIYISNLLQKYLGYLFGFTDDHILPAEGGKKGSRLVMTRLIVIVIGFLLAVAASGLPIDKITIVLGALGVGIGLGLQNIVNNLVSGIILVFERPFQIGDFVELNNKKGIVRDIGIRSSKLITAEGAEIIMPNGDLLSGQVVNWTSRNTNARIDFNITIEAGPGLEDVKNIVKEQLGKSAEVVQNVPPEILLNNITNKTLSLTILVWINNVNKNQAIKSELLSGIYKALTEKEIRLA